MDITNSERLHTKDIGPLQTEVPTSAYKTHSYLQAKIGYKANQTRATKPTASLLLAVQATVDAASPHILLNLQSSALAAICPFGSQLLSVTIVE
ncbi:hypothetical protein BHE74_00034489 [Ensete ventricosum]|nr:hypothetical protein GW17_00029093 [Ensete ventricosum]RWW58620.1 hypothetical protein BHE74_00034489 [Ensete ventricosum]RZS27043.1 hypothetical protein BHM03_00060471 [Ensete ventricosum]